jgi:hypothetical protein
MAYSRAKLKCVGDKEFPYFSSMRTGKASDMFNYFPV